MISVIVPVYNVEKYIINCIESIINQDYKDFELILVNDGSTDNSEKIIKDYLKDKNINWQLINKENGGQSSARNAGLKASKGDYISFIDSDDVISKDFLSTLLNNLTDDVDFSFCNYEFVKKQIPPVDNNDKIKVYEKEELLKDFLKRTVYFVLPSMLFKKAFLDKNGLYLNENTFFSEDQMSMWDVIFNSSKSVYLNKKMYGYYIREKSVMTGSSFERLLKGFEEYKKFIDYLYTKYPEHKDIIKYILPRFKIGTLYTASALLNKEDFNKLYVSMNGKSLYKEIKGIGEVKAIMLCGVASISCNLLYTLCRKLKENE